MKTFNLILAILLSPIIVLAQSLNQSDSSTVISLDRAVDIALERNFNIRIAQKDLEVIQNNNTAGNAGLLPRVDLNAGYTYSSNNANLEFANPDQPPIEATGAVSKTLNAGAAVTYNLFNGGSSVNTFKQLQNQQYLSELQLRARMELTILNVMDQYLNTVARLEEYNVRQESVTISLDRLNRARENYNFGIFSKVEFLNAEVDLRNDSTSLITARLQYQNALKNLSNTMGIAPDSTFNVSADIEYDEDVELGKLLDDALMKNSNYLATRASLTASELDIKIAEANYFPVLDLSAGYTYNRTTNDASFIISQQNYGWNAGATLSYNLFNGGNTRRAEQNAKIQLENTQIQIEQTENQLKTDLLKAYNNFVTNKELLALNIRNLELAETNYERSEEAFKTGEINGLQLREAQLNLLNSRYNVVQLAIQTKVSQTNLYYLSGKLVEPED